jgi:peptidoglycan/LPS O-acetylase OafA/YrhL
MPAFVYGGRISYGLYVFHPAAIRLVDDLWWPWRLSVAFALTWVVAAVSYRYLELPFLRLKRRFTWDFRHTPVLAGAVSPLGGAAARREL